MVSIPLHRLKPCALTGLLLSAFLAAQVQAQTAPPATRLARPDPLDPKAQVPAVRYESSLAQIRRMGDNKPVAWRDANEAVARIGGWRVYAREAQQPDPAPSTQPAALPAQAPTPAETIKPTPASQAGHAGHKP